MNRSHSSLVILALTAILATASLRAETPAAPPVGAPTPAVSKGDEVFADPLGGFELTIPAGYRRLSDDERRRVFDGLSQHYGTELVQRTLKRPPTWFIGPDDPKVPAQSQKPPSFGIGYTEFIAPVDPTQLDKYKEQYIDSYKRKSEKAGDVEMTTIQVAGITALKVEHDLWDPVDRSNSRVIQVSIPGPQHRYDIYFNFSHHQAEEVRASLNTVLNSFKMGAVEAPPEAKSKWSRVLLWTLGGLFGGIVVGYLLLVLSGGGDKPSDKPV